MYLLVVDTKGIQSYIFGSNQLRENIGASYLVAEATETWTLQAVQEVATSNNIHGDGKLDPSKHIEDPVTNLTAEVLYAGGGNFAVLFQTKDTAKNFTQVLSQKALREAPNLQPVIAHHEFDWKNDLRSFLRAFDNARDQLDRQKRARVLSAPLLGLGVTVMCQSTGLPAVGMTEPIGDDPGYPASVEIHAKIVVASRRDQQPSTRLA
jgi:hypothetical protein